MDRNELAARFAVADYGAKCRAYYAGGPKGPGPDVYSGTAEDAFKMADLFLDYAERIDARPVKSTPTPAPVAPPAGKYEPAVGDIVEHVGGDGEKCCDGLIVKEKVAGEFAADYLNGETGVIAPSERLRFVRDSTDAEKRAAGLAVPPPAPTHAPEAKRPEWVRYVGATTDAQKAAPRRVLEWVEDRAFVGCASDTGVVDENRRIMLWPSEWEPCDPPAPCPPPVAGRGETLPDDVRELLLDIEHAAKWANQPDAPEAMYVRIRLRELAACAHDILALSRPVRP